MNERVVAAVPTYNAGGALLQLASQLDKQGFDEVYILDDASTDGSVERLRDEFSHFQYIQASENKGPAANRNRLLDKVHEEMLLFVDADMTLETDNLRETVRRALGEASVGLAGGYILDKQHQPMGWNYGFEMHPRKDAWFGQAIATLWRDDISDKYRAELIEQLRVVDAAYHWASPQQLPLERRRVDWVAEGLFAIRADVFQKVRGYDENMTYHEGQDLARRVRGEGLEVIFDPSFGAVHQGLDVRGDRREADYTESQYYFFQKHWGMPREIFDQLYR